MGAHAGLGIRAEQTRGIRQSGIKIANERAVMTLVAAQPAISGAEIARYSGLGPQTVSRILLDLEQRGFIRHGEVLRGRRGQPATPHYLVPESVYTIGCEIGWRRLTLVLHNMGGTILAKRSRSYRLPDPRMIVPAIAEEVASLKAEIPAGWRDRLALIGLATPCYVERHIEPLGGSPDMAAAWAGADLASAVEQATGIAAEIFNDGDAASWSEMVARWPQRSTCFAYFLVNTFVATGIINRSRLWHGDTLQGPNLGAMLAVGPHGQPGLVHEMASIEALKAGLRAAGRPVPEGNSEDWTEADLEPALPEWLETAGSALAQAIANAAVVVDLGRAVVDAELPRAVLIRLIGSIRHHLDAMPKRSAPIPEVDIGRVGVLAPAIGAAQLPIYRNFFARDWQQLVK